MGMTGMSHWLLIIIVVLAVFGAGKIPRIMSDVAKGVKAFRKGLKEEKKDDASKDK